MPDVDAVELAAGAADAGGVEAEDADGAGGGAEGEDEAVVAARRVARRPQRARPPRRDRERGVRAAPARGGHVSEGRGGLRGGGRARAGGACSARSPRVGWWECPPAAARTMGLRQRLVTRHDERKRVPFVARETECRVLPAATIWRLQVQESDYDAAADVRQLGLSDTDSDGFCFVHGSRQLWVRVGTFFVLAPMIVLTSGFSAVR